MRIRIKVNKEFKDILKSLWGEIKRDSPFFGVCGFFVGSLLIVGEWLQHKGVSPAKESWGTSLFSDFISFNAFGLVFIGLIAISAISTVACSFGRQWQKLIDAVKHVEARLAQISSSIISFTLGTSIFALLYSAITGTLGGLRLFLLILCFNLLLVGGFASAAAIARRIAPFDSWKVALFCLFCAFIAVGLLLVKGSAK